MENDGLVDFKNSFESWLKRSDMNLKSVMWHNNIWFGQKNPNSIG